MMSQLPGVVSVQGVCHAPRPVLFGKLSLLSLQNARDYIDVSPAKLYSYQNDQRVIMSAPQHSLTSLEPSTKINLNTEFSVMFYYIRVEALFKIMSVALNS